MAFKLAQVASGSSLLLESFSDIASVRQGADH